jgi:hypothetical protein
MISAQPPARDSTASSSIHGNRREPSGETTDQFVFPGKFEEGIGQIRNCVPPLFMMAVAAHVRGLILNPGFGAQG